MSQSRMMVLALTAGLALAAGPAAAADGDAKRGKKIFKRCAICHSLKAGKKKIGPSLFAVVDRPAGTMKGYSYSAAIKAARSKKLHWTDANIEAYLRNPKAFLAKVNGKPLANKMPFKLAKTKQRRDVVAFLKTVK